jgi:hypothetical protein
MLEPRTRNNSDDGQRLLQIKNYTLSELRSLSLNISNESRRYRRDKKTWHALPSPEANCQIFRVKNSWAWAGHRRGKFKVCI